MEAVIAPFGRDEYDPNDVPIDAGVEVDELEQGGYTLKPEHRPDDEGDAEGTLV